MRLNVQRKPSELTGGFLRGLGYLFLDRSQRAKFNVKPIQTIAQSDESIPLGKRTNIGDVSGYVYPPTIVNAMCYNSVAVFVRAKVVANRNLFQLFNVLLICHCFSFLFLR